MRRWRKRNASSLANTGRSGRISSLRTSAVNWLVRRGSSGVSAWTTAWWNTSPSTAPRSSTDRSGGSSWSRRAAISAWSVGGTSTSPPSDACTIAAISSTKSGLPPAARRIRSRTSDPTVCPPIRASISASAASGPRGWRRMTPLQPLRRESRLAHPSRPDDRNQLTARTAARPLPGLRERCQLPLAPDQGRVEAPFHRRSRHGNEPPGRHGLTLALQRQGLDRLRLDRVSSQPQRRLAEQGLTGLRGLLQPRGDIDRVTRREPLLGARHHLPATDADPSLDAEFG